MEDNRQEQIEALEILKDFNEKLLHNIPILVKELSGERLDDTDKFLKGVIDAMNWEIGVMNGTLSLLNEGEERIDKEAFNQCVIAISDAYKAKDDMKLAETIQAVQPYFEKLGMAARDVTR